MRKKVCYLLIAMLLLSAFVGCQGGGTPQPSQNADQNAEQNSVENADNAEQGYGNAASTPQQDQPAGADYPIDVFTVGTTTVVNSLAKSDGGMIRALMGTSAVTFLMLDDQGNCIPGLVSKWETDDAKLWTFEIRDDYTWHDGEKVTAEDMAFTLEYSPRLSPAMTSYLRLVESATALSDTKFEVRLSEPDGRFLSLLASVNVLPKHVYEGVEDPNQLIDDTTHINCGPYKFTSFDPDSGTIELDAYEDYWRGKPNVKKIIFKIFANPDTMYMALDNGEIDMIYNYSNGIDPAMIEEYKDNDKITLQAIVNTGYPAAIYFNHADSLAGRLEFRQAVSYALDYDKMITLFGTDYAINANYGILPQGSRGYIDTPKLERNIDKAKELLEAMGATDSDGDGMYELDGKPLEFEITVNNGRANLVRMVEIVQTDLKDAGITVTINSVDSAVFLNIADLERTHQALLAGATPSGLDGGPGAGTPYYDSRYYGWSMVSDPEFHSLVDSMNAATTNEQYTALVGDLQRYYAADLPAVVLYWDSFVQAYSSRFTGFETDYYFGLLNAETMFSIKAS